MYKLIDKLFTKNLLSRSELALLIENYIDEKLADYLFEKARYTCKKTYKNHVYVRALVEISSFCKNDCLYCGIRCSNKMAQRYRLTENQILSCCETGYKFGFRTFVLQGGEDPYFTDERIVNIVSSIKNKYPDCAITLSIGQKSFQSYKKFFDAGANRYLLRHETASEKHYERLHPSNMLFNDRIRCLDNLKKIGYQTGCGFMVGSPHQTISNIVNDLQFIKEFKPEMVGIGPFIPHKDTPFYNCDKGSVKLTLFILGLVRLLIPKVLLPATTALKTVENKGYKYGILAGANVIMKNLSPIDVQKKYTLYNNKITSKGNIKLEVDDIKNQMKSIGYKVVVSKGDFIDFKN